MRRVKVDNKRKRENFSTIRGKNNLDKRIYRQERGEMKKVFHSLSSKKGKAKKNQSQTG